MRLLDYEKTNTNTDALLRNHCLPMLQNFIGECETQVSGVNGKHTTTIGTLLQTYSSPINFTEDKMKRFTDQCIDMISGY